MGSLNGSIVSFPSQKKSAAQKTKDWYKSCVDSAENLISYTLEAASKNKMQVLEDLYNDIIDVEEMEKVFNPTEIQGTFPAAIKNYPISKPKVDVLIGEELKRKFDWVLRPINDDAVSHTQSNLSQMLLQIVIDEVMNSSSSEEDAQKKIQDFAKYSRYEYKELQEIAGTRLLQYYWREQEFKEKFNRGFKEALIKGHEGYRVDIQGNEPVLIRCNAKNVYTFRRGESPRWEDSDIILEIEYLPIGKVIDEFYEYLKASEIEALENYHSILNTGGTLNYMNKSPEIYTNFGVGGNIEDGKKMWSAEDAPFDLYGNVRVVRARWVGRVKIGKVSYFGEDGEELEKMVSEHYVIDESLGETVKWMWVNEAQEATKIAENIYVKMQPREIQMRHLDNHSKCFLGYVGTDYGKSLMGVLEPYQYLYNVYMRRLELAFSKYKGAIYELDISKVPDDWDMEQWMYYAEVLGWAVVDPFNEGKKGEATGKLSGNFNTTGKVLESKMGDFIQQTIGMLNFIEQQLGQIAGITRQREGNTSSSETVGGIERAVAQSNHITEEWFFIHDETRKRAMIAFLDTAKYALRKVKSKKLNFVLDDMSRILVEVNGEDLASTEFDLFVSSTAEDMELRQTLKQLAHAYSQNGGSISAMIKVLRSDSISDMARQLETEEIRIREEAAQIQKDNQETQMQIAQMAEQSQQAERELKLYEIDSNNATKLAIAQLQAESKTIDDNRNGVDDRQEINNKQQELNAKVQADTRKSQLDERKIETQREIQAMKDKAAMEREKIKAANKPKIGKK